MLFGLPYVEALIHIPPRSSFTSSTVTACGLGLASQSYLVSVAFWVGRIVPPFLAKCLHWRVITHLFVEKCVNGLEVIPVVMSLSLELHWEQLLVCPGEHSRKRNVICHVLHRRRKNKFEKHCVRHLDQRAYSLSNFVAHTGPGILTCSRAQYIPEWTEYNSTVDTVLGPLFWEGKIGTPFWGCSDITHQKHKFPSWKSLTEGRNWVVLCSPPASTAVQNH